MSLLPPLPCDDHGYYIRAEWTCPVCGAWTPITTRPGRPRVYCTNACRQKAYRRRRAAGVRLVFGDGQPTDRARGRRLNHLLRPRRDPVGEQRTSQRQAVSLCGAFVLPMADLAHMKPDFRFDDANNCFACLDLTGAGRPTDPMVYPWQMSRRDYTGPPLEPRPARPGHALEIRGLLRRWRRRRRAVTGLISGDPDR